VADRCDHGHRREQLQKLLAVGQMTAREFADDEGVNGHLHVIQQLHQRRVLLAQMVYPNRCINQHAFTGRQRACGELPSGLARYLPVPQDAERFPAQ